MSPNDLLMEATRTGAAAASLLCSDDAGCDEAPLLSANDHHESGLDPTGGLEDGNEDAGGERLIKALSWFDGVAVAVGIIVGSGIFASPGQMIDHLGSTGLSLVVWATAGLIALCSSLVYAELSPAIPTAGGDRDYLRMAFGPSVSFAYTLSMFFVIRPGGQGILTVTFARYMAAALWPGEKAVDDSDVRIKALAVGSLLSVALLNCTGARETTVVQTALTASKGILLILMAASAAVSLSTSEGREIAEQNLGPGSFEGTSFSGVGPALVGALWAFDGWNGIAFLAEELREPQRLPIIIVVSMAIVSALYVAMNICYYAVLPVEIIRTSTTIALDTASHSLGQWVVLPAAVLVAMSALGAANGSVMCGSRLFYASARDGELPEALKTLSTVGRVPYVALLFNLAVSVTLICLPGSTFSSLVSYFGAASWLWYAATGVAMLKLRVDAPGLTRPYRCPAACAMLIVIVASGLILSSIYNLKTRFASLWSLGFVAAPLVSHLAWRRLWLRPPAM